MVGLQPYPHSASRGIVESGLLLTPLLPAALLPVSLWPLHTGRLTEKAGLLCFKGINHPSLPSGQGENKKMKIASSALIRYQHCAKNFLCIFLFPPISILQVRKTEAYQGNLPKLNTLSGTEPRFEG